MQPTWNPSPGQIALFEGQDGLCLTGVVLGSEPDGLRVDVSASPTPLPAGATLMASFFQADALYQATATIGGSSAGSVLVALSGVERIQRRTSQRAKVVLPVCLTCLDGPDEFVSVVGTTIDIGVGGCRVRTVREFPEGADPTVTIDLDLGHTVVVGAHVVTHVPRPDGWEYRIAFDEMDEAGAKLLADLV